MPLKTLEFTKYSHQPSWKRPLPANQKGNAQIRFNTHTEVSSQWLGIFSSEMYTTEKGRVSQRTTMITLDQSEAKALLHFLNQNVKV